MTFTLHVDGPAWRQHTQTVRDSLRAAIRGEQGMARLGDLVPVAKGNGYGLGLANLATEATRLGVDRLAVGTVFEIAQAAEHFQGDILVLSPWDPRDTVAAAHWQRLQQTPYASRVIRTVSDIATAKAINELPAGTKIVIEGITSMRR
ncbi:MAG: alanine racemase, partial [Candidatus Nanopelagicales bacterium]|nr:alanine racemase [Candidatus Nanopelagicales bacterium]